MDEVCFIHSFKSFLLTEQLEFDLKTIKIIKIDASYSAEISALLCQSTYDYVKYFNPFSFDIDTIKSNLEKAKKDIYFGIFVDHKIVGFYMLRGWDIGYEVPAYGVFISSDYQRLGLGKLSLEHAISVCRVNNIKKIMLKVHPENLVAKCLYEASGFINTGSDRNNDNLIYLRSI